MVNNFPGVVPRMNSSMRSLNARSLVLIPISSKKERRTCREQHIEKLSATWGSPTFHLLLHYHNGSHAFCRLTFCVVPALPFHNVSKTTYFELSQSRAYLLLTYLSFNTCPSNNVLKIGLNLLRLELRITILEPIL